MLNNYTDFLSYISSLLIMDMLLFVAFRQFKLALNYQFTNYFTKSYIYIYMWRKDLEIILERKDRNWVNLTILWPAAPSSLKAHTQTQSPGLSLPLPPTLSGSLSLSPFSPYLPQLSWSKMPWHRGLYLFLLPLPNPQVSRSQIKNNWLATGITLILVRMYFKTTLYTSYAQLRPFSAVHTVRAGPSRRRDGRTLHMPAQPHGGHARTARAARGWKGKAAFWTLPLAETGYIKVKRQPRGGKRVTVLDLHQTRKGPGTCSGGGRVGRVSSIDTRHSVITNDGDATLFREKSATSTWFLQLCFLRRNYYISRI